MARYLKMRRNYVWSHRNTPQIVCISLAAVLVILVIYASLYDPCDSGQILQTLCERYDEHLISGSLCYSLCKDHSLKLGKCVSSAATQTVFHSSPFIFVVPGDLTYLPSKTTQSHSHEFPPEGMRIEQFESAVRGLLTNQLGNGYHIRLLQRILNFADLNNNQQISLTEARSTWLLLQNHEFLMTFLFQDEDHIASVNGTCGSLFAKTSVPNSQLYSKNNGFISAIFSTSYLWGAPDWLYRVKIVVMLLDVIFSVYEENGTFYFLCDMTAQNIGYTHNYDLKVIDLSHVYPDLWLEHVLHNVTCTNDSHCMFTDHCTTMCDYDTQMCSGMTLYPNLRIVCNIMNEYLVPSANGPVLSVLQYFIAKCLSLNNRQANIHEEHSLLFHDIHTYLFSFIKNRSGKKYDFH